MSPCLVCPYKLPLPSPNRLAPQVLLLTLGCFIPTGAGLDPGGSVSQAASLAARRARSASRLMGQHRGNLRRR